MEQAQLFEQVIRGHAPRSAQWTPTQSAGLTSDQITSIHLPVFYDQPGVTQDAIGEAIDAGFQHIVLGLAAPYPATVAQWVSDELIAT